MTQQWSKIHSGYFFVKNNLNNSALPSDFIYDQTYKSYKVKQKFQKNRKFSYFNAVMQMKRKLSAKQQVYKSVFEPEDQNQQNQSNHNQTKKYFHRSSLNINDTDEISIKKINKNSFKIIKQHSADTINKNQRNSLNNVSQFNRTGFSYVSNGRKSQISQNNNISFQMINKHRNNKNYVQLQVNETSISSPIQTFNPRPRLDNIMAQFRKINRQTTKIKNKKCTLPKQVIDKVYMTNKMINYPRNKIINI